MSRIGKTPVAIPASVKVTAAERNLKVEGPKGSLDLQITGLIDYEVDGDKKEVRFTRSDDTRKSKSLHGLYRSLFANMVTGVTEGYKKTLVIEGVGYRAVLKGKEIELNLGYCDPKILPIPEGIEIEVPQMTRVIVSGINKEQVGQFAALIRKQRPPEPYKGKGIAYEGEVIRRKAGKTFVGEE